MIMIYAKPSTILLSTFLALSLLACSSADATKPGTEKPHWTEAFPMPSLLAEAPTLVSMDDLKALLDQPWYAAIDVQGAANPVVTSLNTCREYFYNKTSDLRALREYEQSAFAELEMACEATRLLTNAANSSESFLPVTILDENTPQQLPKVVALITSTSERDKAMADAEKQVWADVNAISATERLSDYQVRYISPTTEQVLSEIGRGDFNGDGVEDVLLSSQDSVKGGSYANVRLFVLSMNENGEWLLLDSY